MVPCHSSFLCRTYIQLLLPVAFDPFQTFKIILLYCIVLLCYKAKKFLILFGVFRNSNKRTKTELHEDGTLRRRNFMKTELHEDGTSWRRNYYDAVYIIKTLAKFPSMSRKQWFQVEVGNDIVMQFLFFFIPSLEFKQLFMPIEANSESVYLRKTTTLVLTEFPSSNKGLWGDRDII